MQNNHIFEYAVIRLVPKVEREEFINIGVIMCCAKLNYIDAKFTTNELRIKQFAPNADIVEIKQHIDAFLRITRGEKKSGPIGQLDTVSRFRWLTATRSTIIQPSKIHPGFCIEKPSTTIDKLFLSLVD